MRPLILCNWLFVSYAIPGFSQCVPIGGVAGTLWDASQTQSVQFTVSLSPTASMINFYTGQYCGILGGQLYTPWSGNNPDSIMSTLTYEFSDPVMSMTYLVLGTGAASNVPRLESFTYTTNTIVPTLTVDQGTCDPWTTIGNTTTSPDVIGGFNSYHTVSSSIPFTRVSIDTYGLNTNGGSMFALCSGSAVFGPSPDLHLLLPDTAICPGDTIQLNASIAGTTSVWENGSTEGVRNITEAGTYWVQLLLDGVFIGSDTVHVSMIAVPVVDLGPDTAICPGEEFVLAPDPLNGTWTWSTGSNAPALAIDPPQEVWLVVTLNGCEVSDTIHIALADCSSTEGIPNIFTPNADGVNDRFAPVPRWSAGSLGLTIQSRFGNVVFVTADAARGWDGRAIGGMPCPAGTYFWTITGTAHNDTRQQASGVVTLLR